MQSRRVRNLLETHPVKARGVLLLFTFLSGVSLIAIFSNSVVKIGSSPPPVELELVKPPPLVFERGKTDIPVHSPNVYFKVLVTHTDINKVLNSGGGLALHQLVLELRALGQHVETLPMARYRRGRNCGILPSRLSRTAVIFPEGIYHSCALKPKVQVRWILMNMGANYDERATNSWKQDDWVYQYQIFAPGAAMPVRESNLMVVLRNPHPGDATDVPINNTSRRGTCYVYRKGKLFHKPEDLKVLHKPEDTEIPSYGPIEDALAVFSRSEYCILYDPYTALQFLAAMLGCIPVVHPLGNLTKDEWLTSHAFGVYFTETKSEALRNMVSYGWEEIEEVRANVGLKAREEMLRVKQWGTSTVQRFVNDFKSHVQGNEEDITGRVFVRDYYPTGWVAPKKPPDVPPSESA